MTRIQDEFLNFQGLGASLIEISHRSSQFQEIVNRACQRFTRLAKLPSTHKTIFVSGGARMQFSAIPMNLMDRSEETLAHYVVSGIFSGTAAKEAALYGNVDIIASSEDDKFRTVPSIDPDKINEKASYLHITDNNTIYGTSWQSIPETKGVPLVIDATSNVLSREMDYSKVGLLYAGFQKNLGPSGSSLVVIREDLLDYCRKDTPSLLKYRNLVESHSLANTPNTFAIYVMELVLEWLENNGGIAAQEKRNLEKARLIYETIDASDYYTGHAHKDHRSIMNATFNLPTEADEARFLNEADKAGLFALKGHRVLGGIRASLYNPMPKEGVEALCDFMRDFEKRA